MFWYLVTHFFPHWRGGVVVITTVQLHSTKPDLCTGSDPTRGVSEIRDGEDVWQWSRLVIRLNAFRRSTIPQKRFIIQIQFNLPIWKTSMISKRSETRIFKILVLKSVFIITLAVAIFGSCHIYHYSYGRMRSFYGWYHTVRNIRFMKFCTFLLFSKSSTFKLKWKNKNNFSKFLW